jgi:TPR repeat protein/nucleoside-triphosphatase THEP1
MSRANKTIANIYNPLNQDKKSLLNNFVIRQKEFNTVFRDLKNSKLNQTSQNFLIQGQRGSGKTTLLAKLRYEIQDSKNLSHLLVIQFTEEQYNIFSLNRLWETIADELEEVNGFEKIAEEMSGFEDDDDFYFLLEKYLKKNKKKLVLLIDNFGDILDKLNEIDHKKLRDILHESDLQIIAASTKTLETAYKHDKPFFESFKTIYLDALSKTDVQILLENLSNQYENQKALDIIKNQKGRIETIRRLTGGIPRTIILLYEIILDDSASVFEDLEGVLDKITPLYKHKMDDLATQQQVIVDAIALNWDGILTSEISKKTNLETKTISSQLKILEKSGFILSKLINKKNKLYMLDERFFNIWYLMRYGRKKKRQQVLWLVSFLKEWCTEDELIQKAKNHITLAKAGSLNQRGGYYMAEALSQSVPDIELQYEVLTSTNMHISQTNPELEESLSKTDEMVFEIANQAHKDQNFKKAEKYYLIAIENKDTKAMYNLGWLYKNEFKNFKKAEKYYLMAIEHKDTEAMFALALLYKNEYQDFKKAEKYYLIATENKNTKAMNALGWLYQNNYKDFKKAEKYYLMAIENKDTKAMNNLGWLYINEFKDFKKAEKYLLIATKNKNTNAMNNLGRLYINEFNDFKKAEKYYLMAIENKDTKAIYNLGWLYQNKYQDYKKAEEYYLMAIENKDTDAMYNLGWLYINEFNDFKKAEKYYLMATENKDTKAMNALGWLYQNKYQDFKKAEKYYLMAIENKDADAIGDLASLYQYQLKNHKNAEKCYLDLVNKKEVWVHFNMALLYEKDFQDCDKAKTYYLMAIENDFTNNMEFLMQTTFVNNEVKNDFLSIFKKYHNDKNHICSFSLSTMMIHAGKYKKSIEYFDLFLELTKQIGNFQKHITNYFMLLISKKQYHLAFTLFQENKFNLKEKVKPVYYALMNLLKNEYPKEYSRMGSEIRETVFEVLEKIKLLEKKN